MTALVTGASSGLGATIARRLAEDGHDVAIHCRTDLTGARGVATDIGALGRRSHIAQRDLASADADQLDLICRELLEDVTRTLGHIDVVVLNAFPQDTREWAALDTRAWDAIHHHGLRPTAALLRAAGERLRPGGVIVTIGSIEGLRPAPSHAAYGTAKAALHHLTAAAAFELGKHGIRVVGVAPGLIDRDTLEQDWPQGLARWNAASALGRPVTAEEVAATVAFLASPNASGVTGVTIPVDAGWSAAPGW